MNGLNLARRETLASGQEALVSQWDTDIWRRWTVRLIVLFLILLPFEGIARKWLFNTIEQPFILIRDPVALAIIVTYARWHFPEFPRWLILWLTAVAVLLLLGASQVIVGGASLPALLYGLRIHLLFIPVSFAMAEVFLPEDWRRLILLCCWICLPLALLVIWQYYSPVDAWINRGVNDDPDAYVFQVVAGVVRPYGPFPFVTPQSAFTLMLVGLLLAAWDRRNVWNIPLPTLLIGAASLGVTVILSGSRAVLLGVLLVGVTYGMGGLLFAGPMRMARRILALLVVAVMLMLAVLTLFPEVYDAMLVRQAEAFASEGSIADRLFQIISPMHNGEVPLSILGEGLGAGSNAGGYLASGSRGFLLSEYELRRVLQEGGIVVGGLLLAFRLAILLWALSKATRAAHYNGSAGSFALIGVLGSLFFLFQLSGQNQIAAIGWLSCGLLLCCLKLSQAGGPADKPDHLPDYRARMALRAVSARRMER
ncbi:hypothetical protein GRI39_11315 [Altererythrobacter indicus]|uniref:O-antigen ligase domain-containing protein n=1 Tax=Altericroceibacterium indicum TaxID=374177 RepID=A0A845AAB1_9SPHN|nr:hypothetical protein [Altericroceibacterium indicum]MXP26624.1 hypothetical protein [Altericroceibacterium indicum]